MSIRFFDFSSPRDMLNKAKRELVKIKTELDLDIYNILIMY
jgi:hypothetical protein